MSDLSPCPDCGGECQEGNAGNYAPFIECINEKCDYLVMATKHPQAIAHHEQLAGRCRWGKEFPDEQCYWWWIADDEAVPLVVVFLWSGTTRSCFASMGQLGWKETRDREWFEKHYPNSRWMKVEEPTPPNCGKKVEEVELQ